MKKVVFVLLLSSTLLGCATFRGDTGPGAGFGTMAGGYAGYVAVEAITDAHPMLSILGAVGGAAAGRKVGGTLDAESPSE